MTPKEIDDLLQEGAQRNNMTVEEYRSDVNEIANKENTTFEKTLIVLSKWGKKRDKMSPTEKEMEDRVWEELREEAARLGCTTAQLVTAKVRMYAEEKAKPAKKTIQ